jgi:hypothetical protein
MYQIPDRPMPDYPRITLGDGEFGPAMTAEDEADAFRLLVRGIERRTNKTLQKVDWAEDDFAAIARELHLGLLGIKEELRLFRMDHPGVL